VDNNLCFLSGQRLLKSMPLIRILLDRLLNLGPKTMAIKKVMRRIDLGFNS